MRILITGPDPLLIQGAVNVLGGRGHQLHVADPHLGGLVERYGLARWPSRWVTDRHEIQTPLELQLPWIQEIGSLAEDLSIDTILPVGNHLGALATPLATEVLGPARPALPSSEAIVRLQAPGFLAGLGLPTNTLTTSLESAPVVSGIAQFLFHEGKPLLVHPSIIRQPWRPGHPAAATTMTVGRLDLLDAATTIGSALSWEGPLVLGFDASYDGDYVMFNYQYALAELGDPGNAALVNIDLPSRWMALARPDLLAFAPGTPDQLQRAAKTTSFAGLGPSRRVTDVNGASGLVAKSHAFTLLDSPRLVRRIAQLLHLGVFRGSVEVLTPGRTDLATRKLNSDPRG